MFNRKVLVILGAGASNECGMPLGADLTKRVAESLKFQFEY